MRRYGRRDVVCWFTGSSVSSSWHLTATASESHVTSNQAGQQRMDGQWSSEWVEQGLALKPWPMSAFTRLSYFSVAGRNRHSQGHLGKGGFIGDSPLEREPTTLTAGSVPARARRSSRNSWERTSEATHREQRAHWKWHRVSKLSKSGSCDILPAARTRPLSLLQRCHQLGIQMYSNVQEHSRHIIQVTLQLVKSYPIARHHDCAW